MADSDARAKAAKLKAKARRRRKRKAQEQELADKTLDTDDREAAKSKRRKLQEKGKKATKSVAGTLKGVAGTLKQGASDIKRDAKSAVSKETTDSGGMDGEASDELEESRADVFKRGLSKIGNRLESAADTANEKMAVDDGQEETVNPGAGAMAAFMGEANEYDPTAEEGPDDEGENDAAAIATLAGAGFGGPGDPAVLVGVDEDQDGQIEQDELGFLGPPPQQSQADTESADGGETRAQPTIPGMGMGGGGGPQIPMLGGADPDTGVFGDADMGNPMLPGFGDLDDRDGELADPYAEGYVSRDGPRF